VDDIKRIIFWEPCLSPHKHAFLEALQQLVPNVEIVVCAQQDIPVDRKKMGWVLDGDLTFKHFVDPDDALVTELALFDKNTTIHVVSGIRHVPVIIKILHLCKENNLNFGIMSEPRDSGGVSGALRFLQSWITEYWLRNNAKFILAIGKNGPPWFRSVGYGKDIVFPFAYFVDSCSVTPYASSKPILEITYVGRLTKRKGVKVLLAAIKELPKHIIYHLNIAGSGDQEKWMKDFIAHNSINASMIGVLSIKDVPDLMRKSDVLVLPSTSNDDGWGVVVSEALLNGTQVIATECVGASILTDRPDLGRTILPNQSASLASAIAEIAIATNLSSEARDSRIAWAETHISSLAGAKYFVKVMNHCFRGLPPPQPYYE